MAWKAPGEGDKNKGDDSPPKNDSGPAGSQQERPEHDPWREGRQRPSTSTQQPPDLDDVAKRIWRSLFGKRRAGGQRGPSTTPPRKSNALILPGIIVGAAALVWLGAGVYTIDDDEVGVVMRQGHYHGTVAAGIHWNPSLIDRVIRVNVAQDHSLIARQQQLTQDGSLVTLHVRARYHIVSAVDYIQNVEHPEQLLQNALETAVGHVVSSRPIDELLSSDRAVLANAISGTLHTSFPGQLTGVELRDVDVEDASVPKKVEAAMAAAKQAHQQAKIAAQQAETQRDHILVQAEREAHQIQEEARTYHDMAQAQARTDIAQYLAVLRTYERAPDVTCNRLYLDAISAVMATPGIHIVNTLRGDMPISVAPTNAPVPSPQPPISPLMGGVSANEQPSAQSAPVAKPHTTRDGARTDRDSSERHYDRSLRGGRL